MYVAAPGFGVIEGGSPEDSVTRAGSGIYYTTQEAPREMPPTPTNGSADGSGVPVSQLTAALLELEPDALPYPEELPDIVRQADGLASYIATYDRISSSGAIPDPDRIVAYVDPATNQIVRGVRWADVPASVKQRIAGQAQADLDRALDGYFSTLRGMVIHARDQYDTNVAAREEAEREAAERVAEEERRHKEEWERAKREAEEANRLAREEAERVVREGLERAIAQLEAQRQEEERRLADMRAERDEYERWLRGEVDRINRLSGEAREEALARLAAAEEARARAVQEAERIRTRAAQDAAAAEAKLRQEEERLAREGLQFTAAGVGGVPLPWLLAGGSVLGLIVALASR